MKLEKKLKHYQRFFARIKRLMRNQGRSAIIPIWMIDEIINKYWINEDMELIKLLEEDIKI